MIPPHLSPGHLKDIVTRLKVDGKGTLSRGETQTLLDWISYYDSVSQLSISTDLHTDRLQGMVDQLTTNFTKLEAQLRTEKQKIFDEYFQVFLRRGESLDVAVSLTKSVMEVRESHD